MRLLNQTVADEMYQGKILVESTSRIIVIDLKDEVCELAT